MNWTKNDKSHEDRSARQYFREVPRLMDRQLDDQSIRLPERVSVVASFSDEDHPEFHLAPDPLWQQVNNVGETLERTRLLRQMSEKLKNAGKEVL